MTPFIALGRLLDDLVETLIDVTPEVYVAKPMPGVSGSVGEHVRHTLDHIAALVNADGLEPLSYDHRHRGTAIESDLGAAVDRIFHLLAAIERRSDRSADDRVLVTSMLPGGDVVAAWSSLGRELAFVASHTIHHQAQIALLLAFHGIGVARNFGYAPSTLAAG